MRVGLAKDATQTRRRCGTNSLPRGDTSIVLVLLCILFLRPPSLDQVIVAIVTFHSAVVSLVSLHDLPRPLPVLVGPLAAIEVSTILLSTAVLAQGSVSRGL